jgi:hypothetical protein
MGKLKKKRGTGPQASTCYLAMCCWGFVYRLFGAVLTGEPTAGIPWGLHNELDNASNCREMAKGAVQYPVPEP